MVLLFLNLETLGDKAIEHIINTTDLKVILCSSDKVISVSKNNPNKITKYLVVLGDISEESKTKANENNLKLFSYEDILKSGIEKQQEHNPPLPKDIALICFTSGTTGTPKGAISTHENIIITIVSCLNNLELSDDEVHISYLPLSHIFESILNITIGMIEIIIFIYGGKI
jgi:long-chain acyl-CoA synthetase